MGNGPGFFGCGCHAFRSAPIRMKRGKYKAPRSTRNGLELGKLRRMGNGPGFVLSVAGVPWTVSR